jgi:hypothetical protein
MDAQPISTSHVAPKAEPIPDQNAPMTQGEYLEILYEIENQPLQWRAIADKEMDYADGNQLDSVLLQAQAKLGIPPAMENLIGPALEAIQGYEVATRRDWRVTASGQPGGRDVADAISYRLNQAERTSKADKACSEAFRPQIGVGIGWVEVSRSNDPFADPYRCKTVHRNDIHWDMASGSTDPSEWRYLRRQRWLRPERLLPLFPAHADLIRAYGRDGASWWTLSSLEQYGGAPTGLHSAWDEARAWTIQENRYYNSASKEVCVAELWYRRWVDVGIIESPDGRKVEYDAKNPQHNIALASGAVKYSRAVVPRIRRAYWLGPHCLSDEPTPYTHRHFPYVPFFGFLEDSTGVPYGYVRDLIFQQDTLNSGTAKLRWGMSAVRTERTKGAVAMPDEVFRRTIGRLDADIVLDANHMAQPGARFDVKRDFALSDHQLQLLDNARQAIQRVSPAASGAMSGRRGTATSGIQEQTQVEQANQGLARMMSNFSDGRTLMGEMLMSMIVEDMGNEEQTIIIEGDAVKPDRTVVINKVERAAAGYAYLSNDLQRTRLMVSLEDVPSSPSYRGQQLNVLGEAVKSLPPQYQAAALPFLVSLMDVPFQRDLVEAIRAAGAAQSPEQIEARVKKEVADALAKAGHDLKARELDMKEALNDAQIKKIVGEAVQTGVQAAFSAMQAGAQVAMNPAIAPIADSIMMSAGYQRPNPAGVDPNFPGPAGVPMAQPQQARIAAPVAQPAAQPEAPQPQEDEGDDLAEDMAEVRQNTSPAFPPVPQEPGRGMNGIETPTPADNLPN